MTTQRKQYAAATTTLAEKRQVMVRISAGTVDRAGEVVVQSGLDVKAFLAGGGTVLWAHDPEQPIAKCLELSNSPDGWTALVQFPDEGVSAKADEIYGLIKAGVINGASIGFIDIETELMDPAKPRGAKRYLKTELMEFSFVSIPAVREAVVIERSAQGDEKDEPPMTKTFKIKGLYEVSELASLLNWLSWLEESVEWEAEMEGDGSPLPDMLGSIMIAMGEALIAMTTEEVNELLGEEKDEAKASFAAKTKAAFDMRHKAGRALSSASLATIGDAHDHVTKAAACLKTMMDGAADGDGSDPEIEAPSEKSAAMIAKAARVRVATALSFAPII